MEHQILVVGIGPGSRESMLPAAWEASATAKTLGGGRRVLETLAPPEAKRRVVDADIEGLLNYIEEELPATDEKSRAVLGQMLTDEAQHATTAIAAGGVKFPRWAKRAMTQLSRAMTATTYRI